MGVGDGGDLGAGQAASLCQIASEILGVPLADISVYIGDTALTPPAGGTFATRQLYMSGNAILRAARRLRDQLAPVAAKELGVPEDALAWADGMVRAAPVLPATTVSAPIQTMSASGLPGGPFGHAMMGAMAGRGMGAIAAKAPKVMPRSPAGG